MSARQILRAIQPLIVAILLLAACSGIRNTPTVPPAEPPAFQEPRGKGEPDTDGDGLPDVWEQSGIDTNDDGFVDLPIHEAPYFANPWMKDIFVEIDYMPGRRPSDEALQAVTRAFANAPVENPSGVRGINLHLMLGEEIPHRDAIGWDDFDRIKFGDTSTPCEGYFGMGQHRQDATNCVNIISAWRYVFRYAVIGDKLLSSDDPPRVTGISGIAEVPGNDLMVTLGAWPEKDGFLDRDIISWKRPIPWWDVEAGTLMHELGHTLGLRHGGNVDTNCKPNYLSVMSYPWQFPVIDRPLDFSRATLPPLDKDALDESSGIAGPTDRYSIYGGPDGHGRYSPAGGAIDWNADGVQDPELVGVNINGISELGCHDQNPRVLNGHEDWPNLIYDFTLATDFADGLHDSAQSAHEITFEQFSAFVAVLEEVSPPATAVATATSETAPTPDIPPTATDVSPTTLPSTPTPILDRDGDGIPDATDNCPDIFNPDQANRDGDQFGDACDPDRDNDSVLNGSDNCPDIFNPDQANRDGDRFGDACDTSRFLLIYDEDFEVPDGSDDVVLLVPNEGQFSPDLLRDWQADEPVIVLYLEEGVILNDGTPFDAEYLANFISNRSDGDLIGFEIDEGSIEIVDDYTVLIALGFPDIEGFLIALSRYEFSTADNR